MSIKLATVVVLGFATACTGLSVSAHAKVLHRKYVEEKPAFDESALPKHSVFQLKLKHTDIIYPEDPSVMLHGSGNTHIFRLRADESAAKLKAEEPMATSPMNTRERGIKAQFHSDLLSLLPKIAPDLSRRLDAELNKMQRKLAARVAQDAPAMQRALQARTDAPTMPTHRLPGNLKMPPAPGQKPMIPSMDKLPHSQPNQASTIDAEQARAAQLQRTALDLVRGKMQAQMSGAARLGNAQMPMGAGWAPPMMPQTGTKISAIPNLQANSNLNGQLLAAQQEMHAQLKAANQRNNSTTDVDAKLKHAQDVATQTTPQLDALVTNARRLQPPDIPVTPQTAVAETAESSNTILWDKWHANFANLAHDPLLASLNKAGNPTGSNTVSITVYPDYRVHVSLEKRSNDKFDNAVVQAYKSLNGNARLVFPVGSLRKSISFLVDNKHSKKSAISTVNSTTTTGDMEVHHFGR